MRPRWCYRHVLDWRRHGDCPFDPYPGTSVPVKGSILFGRSAIRRELLIEFLARPRTEGHVREIARSIGRAPAAVGRELNRLEQSGILRSFIRGRNRTYALDADSPIAGEIRALVQRTFGVEATIRSALEGLPGI